MKPIEIKFGILDPPPRPELPSGFCSMHPVDQAHAVAAWLGLPLNDAGMICRLGSVVEGVANVVRGVTEGNWRRLDMCHAIAVRAYGFAALNHGMYGDLCISDELRKGSQ